MREQSLIAQNTITPDTILVQENALTPESQQILKQNIIQKLSVQGNQLVGIVTADKLKSSGIHRQSLNL